MICNILAGEKIIKPIPFLMQNIPGALTGASTFIEYNNIV
ncbi:hypothetical protein yberc0001_39020 [Yersinia bercovieri ATCC 43970]|uniref:Uncharacterized protein n=1 Tax=Yersinia bercovieri ATCC 43970 TaxID=349968 RepID=A0ABM9XTN4_YERBE|nr:hypothetical protein yberc0001_39020 [Yersinia bercovieri ATCC 43970]